MLGVSGLPSGNYVFSVTLFNEPGDDDAQCQLAGLVGRDILGKTLIFRPFKLLSGTMNSLTFAAFVSDLIGGRPDVTVECLDPGGLVGHDHPTIAGTVKVIKVDAVN